MEFIISFFLNVVIILLIWTWSLSLREKIEDLEVKNIKFDLQKKAASSKLARLGSDDKYHKEKASLENKIRQLDGDVKKKTGSIKRKKVLHFILRLVLILLILQILFAFFFGVYLALNY